MAFKTMRKAPRGQREVWRGAENLLATVRAAQVKQRDNNSTGCSVCALMSTVGTLLRVQRPDHLLSTLERQWVAVIAPNRDMRPIACVPSLGELPAVVLDALPAPRTPEMVAHVPHQVGVPEARLRHALVCLASTEVGMSMVVTVSLQHVTDAMQQQRQYAPRPWEESASRWLHVEDLPPTHAVGQADMGKLVVLEGASIGPVLGWTRGAWNGLSSPRGG